VKILNVTHMPNTYLWNNIMFVSQVIFSNITLGLRVNQLVMDTPALADSSMIVQLCYHYWEMKNFQEYM